MSEEKAEGTVLDQIEMAKAFLRIGHLTWAEWCSLDDATRALFIEASEQLEIERASLTASLITTGQTGIAKAMSRIDGGDQFVNVSLRNAMERLVSRNRR